MHVCFRLFLCSALCFCKVVTGVVAATSEKRKIALNHAICHHFLPKALLWQEYLQTGKSSHYSKVTR